MAKHKIADLDGGLGLHELAANSAPDLESDLETPVGACGTGRNSREGLGHRIS